MKISEQINTLAISSLKQQRAYYWNWIAREIKEQDNKEQ